MKKLRVAVVYNSYEETQHEAVAGDSSSGHHLRLMIRRMARTLRSLGHDVVIIHLAGDLSSLQRRLNRLRPHVIFNQYDDVVHGALYEMRFAAFIRMLGYPITGSPALGLGLSRDKYMALSLLRGAGIPIPSDTTLLERVSEVDHHKWHFPLIVHPGQEHAGIGIERDSVVATKKALREKVREVIHSFKQPALVQRFLPGREFNVGILGGRKLRVLPLAEVDYSRLPLGIPPIMSYAAKWVETSVEFKRTTGHLPGQGRAASGGAHRRHGDQGLSHGRRLGLRPRGHPHRRGRAAPRPRGQLQSLPGQGDGLGPFGGKGGDQLSRIAADW